MLIGDFIMLVLAVPFVVLVAAGYALIAAALWRSLRERAARTWPRLPRLRSRHARLVHMREYWNAF
jgi:hypothetical protein